MVLQASRAVVAGTRDRDANVRVAAAQELGSVLDNTRAAWMAAWKADTGFMYRRSVLVSAMSQDVVLPAAELDEPDSWAHQSDWRLRAAVADAGGAAPTILRLREVSLPLARDPDPRVRSAAFGAMAPHADTAESHPWRREFMEYGLTDADFFVRAIAIGSLEGHATAAEVPLVLASYRRAAADTNTDARIAAIRFFASAWKRDSVHFADSRYRRHSCAPGAPRHAHAKRRGQRVRCSRVGIAHRRPTPKPAAWYEQIVRTRILPALAGKLPRAEIVTERGTITVELYAADAPLTVDNFLTLAASGYYDDARFHRVVPNFVAQDGDRRGDGNGGPAYTIRDELNPRRYERGSMGMALSGPDTGGSQYFLMHRGRSASRWPLHGVRARGRRLERARCAGAGRPHRAHSWSVAPRPAAVGVPPACALVYLVVARCSLLLARGAARRARGRSPVHWRRAACPWPSCRRCTAKSCSSGTTRSPSLRIRGEGVARIAPPDSARLDFFVNGQGTGHALLVGDQIRLQGGQNAMRDFLPPAPLLWAALGRLHVAGGDGHHRTR